MIIAKKQLLASPAYGIFIFPIYMKCDGLILFWMLNSEHRTAHTALSHKTLEIGIEEALCN